MIINCISKQIINKQIIFELPQIYLDLNYDHKMTIIDLYVKWKIAPGEHLYTLRTNMIGRTPGNPTQDLINFSTGKNQLYIHHQPTQFTSYKLKFLDIESAVFNLHSCTSDTPENIELIYLRLEIL